MEKLHISEDGRCFVKKDGSIFPWLADTVWTMPQRMKWDDVEYYLKKRRSQGFTVLQICALDPERDVKMRNPSGEEALINGCLETPNEDYFRYLDWILDRAQAYGFYVLLLPVWGQLVTGDNWMGENFPEIVTEQNAYGYGAWIGNRYKDRKNIIWCLGGDRHPFHKGKDYRMVWRNMAEGLAKGLTGERLKYNENLSEWQKLLITYHACHEEGTGECSTMSYWGDEEAWIRFIMLQSGHGLLPRNYELVRMEYERKRSMPVWDGEPAYERMPTSWPVPESFHDEWMVRKRAYWSLLAGAFGYTYGHGCVWCMISEKEKNLLADRTWYEAMHSRGSEQMKYLREAMDSLKFGSLIPCQQLLNKQKKSAKDILNLHIQAALDRERKFLCVYFPSGGEEELVLSEFCDREEELYLWWWKPSDGKFYDKTDLPAEKPERAVSENGILKVKTPSCGEGKDWLLLVYREYTEIPIESRCYYSFDEEAKVQKVFEW